MDNSAKIKERVFKYLEINKINKQKFCDKTGISYGNVTGKAQFSEFGGEQITEILQTFPDISPDWLLLGKGEMLRQGGGKSEGERPNQSPEILEIIKKQQETINNLIEMLQSERSAHPEPGPRMCKNA